MRFETSFVARKPASEVFELLADAERMPEWQVELERVERISGGECRVGTVYRCRSASALSREWTFEWSEYVPGRRLAFRSDPGARVQRIGSYSLSANGSGDTTVRMVLEPRAAWPVKLLAPLFSILLRRHATRDARALSRWLGTLPMVLGVLRANDELLDGLLQSAAGLA